MLYSYAEDETAPDCRLAAVRWIGNGRSIEYPLTSDPMTELTQSAVCVEYFEGAHEDVLGIGEPLFVVQHNQRRARDSDDEDAHVVEQLLVVDSRDGDEVLALDLESRSGGGTFSSGTKAKLERAADGTLEVWTMDYDEANEENCRGTGREDCEPKYVLDVRYTWDAGARNLVRVDKQE